MIRGVFPILFVVVLTLQANSQELRERADIRLAMPTFDLSKSNAKWQFQPQAKFEFNPGDADNPRHWRFVRDNTGSLGRGLWSMDTVPLRPNRRYRLSLLIHTDFAREHSELNVVLLQRDRTGRMLPGRRFVGLPAKTNGWERFEVECITPCSEVLASGAISFWFNLGEQSETPFHFWIADASINEMPVEDTSNQELINQVKFRGGPGKLPLHVDPAKRLQSGDWEVEAAGVKWEIAPDKRTIVAKQRIGAKRSLAEFRFSQPLDDLLPVDAGENVTVLARDNLALGFQCDGMLAIASVDPYVMTATCRFEAEFVRYGDGHLYASDRQGGFTVNPYVARGSGRMPATKPITKGLDFISFERSDLQSLSEAEGNWKIQWTIEGGDRLFVSAFPPRDYPWQQSFEGTWMLSQLDWDTSTSYTKDYWRHVAVWLLWNGHIREWGMSFGDDYLAKDEDHLRQHVNAIHEAGKKAIFYTSAWFFASRDARTYVDAVMEEIDTFDFDGFYTDGLPAVEWLVGYEEMRMLRARIDARRPGLIYVHDSVPQSGRHPAAWMPWLYTYADVTYMAEHVESDAGAEWSWVKYVINGFRSSGGIGAIKGDKWSGKEFVTGIDRYLHALKHNARIGEAGHVGHNERYVPMRDALQRIWETDGDQHDFYEKIYRPLAEKLLDHRP